MDEIRRSSAPALVVDRGQLRRVLTEEHMRSSKRKSPFLVLALLASCLESSELAAKVPCTFTGGSNLEEGPGDCIDAYLYYHCFTDSQVLMCEVGFRGCETDTGMTISELGYDCWDVTAS
jgi:hypothetical protein